MRPRGWLAGLLLAGTLATGTVGAESARDPLEVERAVVQAVAQVGSASLVRRVPTPDPLAEDRLAPAFAEVVLDLARGRESRAFDAGLDALQAVPLDGGSLELRGAIIHRLVRAGLDERGRRLLLEGQHPVLMAGWALQLARDGRCSVAVPRARHLAEHPPDTLAARLMAADALRTCHAFDAAMGLMFATARPRAEEVDPRVALEIGELAYALGDADTAREWCRKASIHAVGLPGFEGRARVCSASADAVRGVLPRARRALVEAWRDLAFDPSVAAHERRHAVDAAVWVAVSGGDPEFAREALEILDRADQVPGQQAGAMEESLRAIALVTLERATDARRALARAQRDAADPEAEVLSAIAQSRVASRENDEIAASARLSEAADEARRAARPDLVAALDMERARLARWAGRPASVRMHATGALTAWADVKSGPYGLALQDPVLPRRALQWAIAQQWTRDPAGMRAELVLEVAAEADRALHPSLVGAGDATDPARVRRLLAARNASVLYYAIGETRSYAWLIQPTGVRGVELPSGDELLEMIGLRQSGSEGRIPALPVHSEQIYGGLLDSVKPGSSLIVRPDGFLASVPWPALPTPTDWPSAEPSLGLAAKLAIVTDLDTAVDPRSTPVASSEDRRQIVAVVTGGMGFDDAGTASGTPGQVLWRTVSLGGDAAPDQLEDIRRGRGVLLVGLPLLAAGRGSDQILFGLPSEGNQARAPLALDELISSQSRYDLFCLVPDPAWPAAPGARTRAAAGATRLGVRTAAVSVAPMMAGFEDDLWRRLLDAMASGKGEVTALGEVARDPAAAERVLSTLLVGQASDRLAESGAADWRFWVPLGGALLLLAIVALRAIWPRRDPFDEEPPEE